MKILDIKNIKKVFNNRVGNPLGIKKNFSVTLPLIYVEDELHILFEVRSFNLNTQPGEISFPGGHVEEGEGFLEAGVRETMEELNVLGQNINVIGELDYIVSPYNFILYSYLVLLEDIRVENINYNKDEVDHIFTVPLKFFLENEPILDYVLLETITTEDFPHHLIQDGKNYNWKKGNYPVYFYKYNDYIIWGMTARITKNFIDILKG